MINKKKTQKRDVSDTTTRADLGTEIRADNTEKVLRPAIIKSIIALIALAAVTITYFALPAEIKNPTSAVEEESEIFLIDGEVAAGTKSLYVFEPLSSSDIKSLKIENTNCSYALTRATDGGFNIDGNENVSYGDEAFASLIVATCNTITNERIYPDITTGQGPEIINYKAFGLDEENMNARYTVTTNDDETYTVRVGARAASDKGYYACLEGREAVYILADDLETTVLGTMENIVTPTLGLQNLDVATEMTNYIDHMTIWNKGEHITTIHSVIEEEQHLIDTIFNYTMTCNQKVTAKELLNCPTYGDLEKIIGINALPYNYVPNIDEYNIVAETLPTLEGDETVAIKDTEEGRITKEQLSSFGIDTENPAYEIFYTFSTDDNVIYNYLIFSEKQEESYYYVYSNLNNVIAKVSDETLYFLDWDYAQWNEPSFFQNYITAVSEVKVKSDKADYTFKLTHTADDKGTRTMTVKEGDDIIDSENFRNFYRVMLSRKLRGAYHNEIPGEDKLYLTLTVTTLEGKTTEYKFYQADTQRFFLTIDGKGEFYCLSSAIKKLENDAIKVRNGIEVGYADWN